MNLNNKGKYRCIVFGRGWVFKMLYVNDLKAFESWLNRSRKYKDWKYFNIYDRENSAFLGRYYK